MTGFLLIASLLHSLSQGKEVYSFPVKAGASCDQILEEFRIAFSVRVAYDPMLSEHKSPFGVIIKGYTPQEVFAKVCEIFRLDYLFSDHSSYLVRSSLQDLVTSKEKIYHIQIKEQRDGSAVPYAAVYDLGKSYFGFTDEFGDCFIRIPDSMTNVRLVVHSLAHRDQQIVIENGKQQHSLKLADDPINMLPVSVSSYRKKLTTLQNQSTGVASGLLDVVMISSVFSKDIVRTIQVLPGVAFADDSKAGLRIRGANEEATLLILDQMPVYKADHFFGVFGAFNSGYIRNIHLYKNNIPVSFGGRTSGLLHLESDAQSKGNEVKIDANLLSTSATANLRINKRFLLKFAARKSFAHLASGGFYDLSQRNNIGKENLPLNLQNIVTSRPAFDFYDANARVVYQHKRHQADLNLFGSFDDFSNQFSSSYKIRQNTISDESFQQKNQWDNIASALNYSYLGHSFDLKLTGFTTRFATAYDIKSNLLRREPGFILRDTVGIYNENSIEDGGVKATVQWGNERQFYAGIEYVNHQNYLLIENERFPVFEVNRRGGESSLWSGMRIGKKAGLFFEPGLRLTRVHSLNKGYLLPQLYVSYNLPNDILLKGSAGRHAQFVRQFDHENALGQRQQFFVLANDQTVPVATGTNTMVGMWKSVGPIVIDVEAYYRWLNGSIMHAIQMPGLRLPGNTQLIQGFRLYQGESRSMGLDVSLIFEKPYVFSMLTYTLSKSDNRFENVFNAQWFPANEDSRHQIKWVNTVMYRKFEASVSYLGATGRPYVDLSALDKTSDRSKLDPTLYLKRLPDYHRWDVGLSYRLRLFGADVKVSGSVFNLLDRTNVKYRQFFFRLPPPPGSQNQPLTSIGSDVTQLERTFNLSFQLHLSGK